MFGTTCSPGTVSPACVLETSRGGVFCLVTPDDECFHSCKQDTFAKKSGLSAKHEDLIIGAGMKEEAEGGRDPSRQHRGEWQVSERQIDYISAGILTGKAFNWKYTE